MTLEFKRGIVISAKYERDSIERDEYTECFPIEELIIRDSEGKEYSVKWMCYNTCFNDFFGVGDKVSFLWDREYEAVSRIKLNPFYKE